MNMIRCPKCGVELDENSNFCSLCGAPLLEQKTDQSALLQTIETRQQEKLLSDYRTLSSFQKRKIFWKISGLILICAMVINLLIDFVANQNITWSKYPTTIIVVLFINFSLYTFLYHKTLLKLGLSFVSVAGLLMLFDFFFRKSGWEWQVGIPLLIATYLTMYVFIFLVKKAKQKGLNIIAYILFSMGLLSVCTESMIAVYQRDPEPSGWSLIVLVSSASIASIMLYIHYKLKKATDLKRFFHI